MLLTEGFLGWDGWRDGCKEGVKGLSSRAEGRERVRGECGLSSLIKQKKKLKFASSFTSPDLFCKKKFCYEVIVKQKKNERFRLEVA